MKNILDQLADHARERVAAAKQQVSADAMRAAADALELGNFEFERALRKPGLSFICECKKASPSKGLIAPDFPYLEIAENYERAVVENLPPHAEGTVVEVTLIGTDGQKLEARC